MKLTKTALETEWNSINTEAQQHADVSASTLAAFKQDVIDTYGSTNGATDQSYTNLLTGIQQLSLTDDPTASGVSANVGDTLWGSVGGLFDTYIENVDMAASQAPAPAGPAAPATPSTDLGAGTAPSPTVLDDTGWKKGNQTTIRKATTVDNKVEVDVQQGIWPNKNSHWVSLLVDAGDGKKTDLMNEPVGGGKKLSDYFGRGQYGSVTLSNGTEYVSAPSGYWLVGGGSALNIMTGSTLTTQDFLTGSNNSPVVPNTAHEHVGPPGLFNEQPTQTFTDSADSAY